MNTEEYTLSFRDLNQLFKIGLDDRVIFHLKSGKVITGKIMKEICDGIIPIGFIVRHTTGGHFLKIPITSIEFIEEWIT